MEALHSRLTTGEQPGDQDHSQPESLNRGPQLKSPSQHRQPQQTSSQKPHGTTHQVKQPRRQHSERKRLRHQRQSIDSDTTAEGKHAKATSTSAKATRVPCPSLEPQSSVSSSTHAKRETQEGTPKHKRERKPQRPGKYVCSYCSRACAKPSVLQKHIRSHTGERPYPCAPCGFSFKTKSNLYKHRKSHTHKVKAGLAFAEPRPLEEQVTESEDEARQLSSQSSSTEHQVSVTSLKSDETDRTRAHSGGMDDSYAVKKRLAMRLSRGKHGPLDSSDENNSSLILGSKGSTESGYFSRSESTEQSQDSPPNTSAKSYAEIILGKYGRLGQLQRMSRQQNQQTSGEEEKSIPFTVPKKQVIDHITKLITINEAVVDTSKIDSVKPRRFSLSRKSSTESQKSSPMKEPIIHSPKPGDPAYKTSGSITMGVPCDKFHHQPLNKDQLAAQTSTVPLSRSHSMPSTASSLDASSGSPCSFRPCQSFEERQPSQIQTSRRMGMLRRQPAIEIPLGAELPPEEHHSSDSFYHDNVTIVPDNKQSQPQPYECEACGTGCKDWEGYKIHKQSPCLAQSIKVIDIVSNQLDRPQLKSHPARPGVSVMRKRRKEESFESDDPSSPVVCSSPSSAFSTSQCRKESDVACEDIRRPTLQTFSVIQHTSSFEKQETLCAENIRQESANISPPRQEYQPALQKQPQQQHSTKPTPRKMVCHQNVRVPEILVTEDSKMHTECILEPIYNSKQPEKLEEFQWPQRSPTLAQLPIEKLPPKKKRLRLAEAAQSSGESSFDSVSLPRSPSQDSSASYASSRSTSFEESSRLDMEATSTTPLRRSRAPHTLTVPGTHQYREMRRSASEQAPHDPQPGVLIAESRSKSFDYSCLSPERSMVGWRERRKCLLMRHSAVRDPEEEEGAEKEVKTQSAHLIPGPVSPSISSRTSPSAMQCGRSPRSPLTGDTVLGTPTRPPRQEFISQWKLSQNIQLAGKTDLSPIDGRTVDSIKEEPSSNCTVHPSSPPLQFPQHYLTQGPSGAARAHYLPMSTGLKLEIPSQTNNEYPTVRVNPPQILHSLPNITMNPELLRPYTPAAVAVRLQTDTLTPAYAIYTTQSQTIPTRLLEPVSAVSYHTSIPESAQRGNKATSAELEAWSADLLRSSGSGGNKRMLSPSNSIELSPESQQQQKRVKEEEERKDRGADKASVVASIEKKKFEAKLCLASICSPVRHIRTSFTSLDSNTCNSWCYLNYIKPNPSPLDEQRPSVYSSWSTGSYDPNPLGLSSKTALSLLHCKQRLSPSIYTMSPMSACTTETIEPDNQRPCSTEVNNQPSSDRDHADTMDKAPPVDDTRSNKVEQEEGEMGTPGASGEKVQSSSIYRDPLQRWTCEEGSSEAHGHSRCQVEEGGVKFECKEHSSEVENPGQCGLSSFDAKGDLSEHLRSQAHGRECEKEVASADNTNEGVCCGCPVDLDKQGDSRGSNVEGSSFDEVAKTKDEVSQDVMDPLTYPTNPEPKSSQRRTQAPKSPARDRRALFARQHQGPSRRGSSSLSLHLSPTESLSSSSPPCQGGPAPHSMSLSTCQVSLALARSPERGPAPARVQSPSSSSLSSAPRQALSPPRDRPATKTRLRRSESVDEPVARTLFFSSSAPYHNPSPSRGAHRVLSHLPLHSQRPSTAPSLTISIGGIHMIRPGIAPPRCSSQGHWPRPEAKESALNRDVPDTRATHTCDYPETAQTPKGSLQPEATLIGGSSYKGTVQKEVDVKRPQKP